jgi:hypothetical protein
MGVILCSAHSVISILYGSQNKLVNFLELTSYSVFCKVGVVFTKIKLNFVPQRVERGINILAVYSP